MVKTLRITSVLAVLLAIGICTLLVKYGVKDDQNINNFLDAPSIADVFRATSSSRPVTPTNQVHPLVQQAEVFAKIINPPPAERPKPIPQNPRSAGTTIPVVPDQVKPKLELISTSYFAAKPELSMALINEPGKGRSWVMQSSKINHLLVKEVRDGVLIISNGDKTYEYKTPEKKLTSPIPPIPSRSGRTNTNSRPTSSIPMSPPTAVSRPVRTSTSKTVPEPPKENEEERITRAMDLMLELQMLNSDDSPLSSEERTLEMKKRVDEYINQSMDINDSDSEKINMLKELFNEVEDTEPEN